ncbi:MAG: winged helix-turn-helix domain-containing protein [Acidobacteriota bacterium]|nr:winged helix-turn-helix domain-containing protein [Acidobacteriota bacterium]
MIRFGPFQIDPRTWTLAREGQPIDLSPRLVEILGHLSTRDGQIVTKDELLERFWPGVNISDNTLTRAVADIRKALGDSAAAPVYVQTLARRGYRFVGSSAPQAPEAPKAPEAPEDDPFQAWEQGRLALESLDLSRLDQAIVAFERAVANLPSYAPAHAGLANAYLLRFETTRFSNTPDREMLERALTAARRACATDPRQGEGWAVLGYLLSAAGQVPEGQAAARRATALEPGNWRHHFRLGYVTWGEERLRAADRLLELMPAFAPARMLSAMVFVARGALARAEQEAARGAEIQRGSAGAGTPIPAAGLHWLRGLIMSARGERDEALRCFDDEIAAGTGGQVYGREFIANARVAAGFVLIERGDAQGAAAHFHQVLADTPRHARATLGLQATRLLTKELRAPDEAMGAVHTTTDELTQSGRQVEASLVEAGERCVLGRATEAVDVLDRMLTLAPVGPAGWIIPVDPMLAAVRYVPGRAVILAKLAARAS